MYTLHSRPDSAGLAVRLTLEELGLPYSDRLVDAATDMPDSPSYRAMQPLGLVPVLETPDGPMFETAAILLWLADRHGGLAPKPEAKDRAFFLKWLFFTSSNLHPTLLQIFYPDRHSGDADANALLLKTATTRLGVILGHLDAMAATHPAWCAPDKPSILGYYIAMQLRWAQFIPDPITLSAYPALHALAAGMETRPAAARAAQIEGLGTALFTNPNA